MANVTTRCPVCGFAGKAPTKFVGKKAKCKQCGQAFTVVDSGSPSFLEVDDDDDPTLSLPTDDAPASDNLPRVEPVTQTRSQTSEASFDFSSMSTTSSAQPMDDSTEPSGNWLYTAGLLAFCLVALGAGIVAVIMLLGSGGAKQIKNADKLFADGKQAEAVALYKANYPAAENKGRVILRIVEFEVQKGNKTEAAKWIERGLDEGLELAFYSPQAKELLEVTRKNRPVVAAAKKEEPPAKKSTSKQPEPEEPTPNEPGVVDAASAAGRFGDIIVSIASVEIGKVDVKGIIDDGTSKNEMLKIKLTIKNQGKNKIVRYRSWAAETINISGLATLQDNFENTLVALHFGIFDKPVGQVKDVADIDPGASLSDLLIFRKPLASTKYLILTLPGENVGSKGAVRLKIPASMFR